MIRIDAMVTMPPDVVRMRASSTVFVKASSRVNRDFGAIVFDCRNGFHHNAHNALTAHG